MLSKNILNKFNHLKELSILNSFWTIERQIVPISKFRKFSLNFENKIECQRQIFVAPLVARFSSGKKEVEVPVASYEEVKSVPKYPNVCLIDVREIEEVKSTGRIPSSINIPLSIVNDTLGKNMNPSDFKQKFGRNKPDTNSPIIFYCLKGMRSQQAAEVAMKMGYSNVKSYLGSWEEWIIKEREKK